MEKKVGAVGALAPEARVICTAKKYQECEDLENRVCCVDCSCAYDKPET